jgi:arylsulfatase A-like enzyme
MYPELMDLVYMIRSPEGEAAGSKCDAYVAHHDIPVTLMNMAGVEPPSDLDGKNAWAWATGESPQTRDHATCMFYPWLWYRDGDHAYMTDIDGAQEKLYDVKRDPKQMVNIAEENGNVCRSIKNLLRDEMGGDPPRYEIMREGHEWYEYPDVYDPTSTISKRIRDRRLKG